MRLLQFTFIEISIAKCRTKKKENTVCFVYIDTCVPWRAIETKNISVFCVKKNKRKKYKNSVCFVYIDTCAPWMAIENFFLNFVSFVD